MRRDPMLILVLESSGNKKGSSNMLAGEFIRGAKDAGHDIIEFDVLDADIRPCKGCQFCGMNGPCAQKDDYENTLKDMIKSCDMIVFAMPVYYYNWPAQMKNVIDRFYSFSTELTYMHKKSALLSVAWDDTENTFDVVKAYYDRICSYMEFDNMGCVLGKGCGTPAATKASKYPNYAYELGNGL